MAALGYLPGEKLYIAFQADSDDIRVKVDVFGIGGNVHRDDVELQHVRNGFFIEDTIVMPDEEICFAQLTVYQPDGVTVHPEYTRQTQDFRRAELLDTNVYAFDALQRLHAIHLGKYQRSSDGRQWTYFKEDGITPRVQMEYDPERQERLSYTAVRA